jgi:hypothetical protein
MDNIRGNPIIFKNDNVCVTRKMITCKQCIYNPVCISKTEGQSQCASFKDKNKYIHVKVSPGDTVWLTKWYNTPDGEIVSRSILYIAVYQDKTIYHCKDGAFDEDGFGVYAFHTLDAAKIITGMTGGVVND